MAFKLFALFALVAAASATPIGYAPVLKTVEVDAHPQYHFAYSVHDDHTGDVKSQEESRDGDVVKGSYSFIEADGSRRVVEYTADDHNGFNAIVHREHGVAKAVVAAPVVAKYAAPLAYHAAPVVHHAARVYRPAPVYHAAPVIAKYAAPVVHHAAPVYASVAHGSYGKTTFSSPHSAYAY